MSEQPLPQVYKRLERLVLQKLKAEGVDRRVLGRYEVKKTIYKTFDHVSHDDENAAAAVASLVRLAKRYEREFGPLGETISTSLEGTLLQPRHGVAWATLDSEANPGLAEAIESIRLALWDSPSPPFSALRQGLHAAERAAQTWLLEQQRQAARSGRMALLIHFDVAQLDKTSYQIHEVFNAFIDDHAWWAAGRPAGPLFLALAQCLGNTPVATEQELSPADLPALRWQAADDTMRLSETGKVVRVPPDGPLRQLYNSANAVARASGWWQPWQALHCIMTGYPPAPQQVRERRQSPAIFRSPVLKRNLSPQEKRVLPWPAWTVTIEGPISTPEWQAMMPSAVSASGTTPRRISRTHVALLQLKAQTPARSWGQRHKVWDQWCLDHPNLQLKRFNDERLLRKEWERAALKVNQWIEAMSVKKPPNSHDSLPLER